MMTLSLGTILNLFCLKNKKPVILLDQSKNGNPIVVKTVKDKNLNQIFEQIYR
ncbi:DUF4767 domain-containing protein [Lactobacillus kefiranofaciens]|nr:DUF4767 domain-containing protein [Lactobacillus kefiranofaciens]WQH36454.1 DUF4767 domain-containing protein [Lactobacillus kefiranofaciens]